MPEYLDYKGVTWIDGLPTEKPASSIVASTESSITQLLTHTDSQPVPEQYTVNPNSMAYFFQPKK